jgi:hypothetical protein
MITVEPTTDIAYIKNVLFNPTIYKDMKDDSCPENPAELMDRDLMSKPGIFLKVMVDGIAAGCFWLIWKGALLEAHTALLENCRGKKAIVAARKAQKWVFSNTIAESVTSFAWSDSPAVAWFCRAVGMKPGTTERWPNTRNGQSVDITHYSINRGDLILCQQ